MKKDTLENLAIEEKIKRILNGRENPEARLIENHEDLLEIVRRLKLIGHKIVFVSGVWDLKHIGHEAYLIKGRDLGDILIVGCDSDALTKKKGTNRPIVPFTERSQQLVNLRSVSIVVPINSYDEADKLIKDMHPDVLLISKSTEANKAGHTDSMASLHRENCGEIVALEPQATTSTTARIRILMLEGVEKFQKVVKEKLDEVGKTLDEFVNYEKNGGSKS